MIEPGPLPPHLLAWLDDFLPGAELRKGDARMGRSVILQRMGLVSAKPHVHAAGVVVVVRVTEAGYAALGRAPLNGRTRDA